MRVEEVVGADGDFGFRHQVLHWHKTGAAQFLRRFEAMDANKDGKVTREEFKGRPALFDRLDADHDGVIAKADLKALREKQKAGEAAANVKKPKKAE